MRWRWKFDTVDMIQLEMWMINGYSIEVVDERKI